MRNGRPRRYVEQYERVKEIYEAGYTIREVADLLQRETGLPITRPTVHRMLKRMGVALRRRGHGSV